MLQLIQSNQVETLLQQLGRQLQQQGQDIPVLSTQTVLVQSQGMRQWLTIELARRNGIAANLETPMPAAFLWQICQRVMAAELVDSVAFDKVSMSWHIMALLPSLLPAPEFKPLQDYLAGHQQEQLQRYQLAYRIADIYDQYLVYRPDWILAWEDGQLDALAPEQLWQALLWQALVARIAATGQDPLHRAAVHVEVQRRLLQGEFDASALPSTIAVFGVSSLPPQQVDLLIALGEVCNVELYAMNPCAQYWGDIVSEKSRSRRVAAEALASSSQQESYLQVGNPLLASWGGQGREFFDLLLERDVSSYDFFVERGSQTLLQSIQQDILQLQSRGDDQRLDESPASAGQDKFLLTAEDHSLQIHSCHSRMREVEVLYDQLLAMLDGDDNLRARDIIVMVPDIAAYAPYVHAVFSQRREQSAALRYTLSDRNSVDESPILRSFMALVELPGSRLGAPEIIDLLQLPALARKFTFSPADIARISYWIEHSGIRWAWDGDNKQEWGLPADAANTWQFGLDRLLLGYAMGAVDGVYRDTLPSDEVDAGNADLLGRLKQFLDLLWRWRLRLKGQYSWRQWQAMLNHCMDDFFDPQDDEVQAMDQLRQGFAKLFADAAVGAMDEPVTPALLRSLLQQYLNQPGGNFGFLSGGISFCTLMPMRSIPFRVVCMLGINDQEFPRQQTTPGFDLIAADRPRRGDRNRRSDDRYQMLEALLAARERLYISYIGRSALDNSDKVASVLLSELLDYCLRTTLCDGDQQQPALDARRRVLQRLLTQHHLQPFDQRYFQAQSSPWFSYAGEYFNAAAQQQLQLPDWSAQSVAPQVNDSGTIRIDSLLAFVGNPCKVFLQQRLGVYLDIFNEELSDTEVLALDGLERYQLGQDALSAQLESKSQQQWQHYSYASGTAPLGAPGELALAAIWTGAETISQSILTRLVPEPELISVSLDVGDYQLEGELGPLHSDSLLSWRPGKFRKRQVLQQWLRHALANAVAGPITTRFIDGEGEHGFAPISAPDARQWLQQCVYWYLQAMQRPLPLFADSGWKWLEVMAKKADPGEAMRQAELVWNGSGSFSQGECMDIYFGRCFRAPGLPQGEFETLAQELLGPAYVALEQGV